MFSDLNSHTIAAASSDKLPKDDVKAYFTVLERMDPKKNRKLWQKLVALHGDKQGYSPDEVQDVSGPPRKGAFPPEKLTEQRKLPVPAGAFDRATAERSLEVGGEIPPKKSKAEIVEELRKKFANKSKDDVINAFAATKSTAEDPIAALHKLYDDQPWYTAQELRDVQQYGSGPRMKALPQPEPTPKPGWHPLVEGIEHFMIRQSWSDVLYSEDLSQPSNQKKKIDDLVGAKFSWTGDLNTHSDTWSAVGALLFPLEWKAPVILGGWSPYQVVLAPSVSINKVSSSDDPTKNVDQLFYRLGALANWELENGAFQLRGAFVYGTDTSNQARLPAFEMDVEPQFGWFQLAPKGHEETVTGAPFAERYLKIGYKNILIPKKPELEDQSDNSLLDYQLRMYLHVEGGDLQETAGKWNVVTGSFLRLGPALQLRINAPKLVFGHALGITAFYSYLPAITGTDEHESLFQLDLSVAIFENVVTHQKVTFTASYAKGGLDFTKTDVDLVTVGLGVLF